MQELHLSNYGFTQIHFDKPNLYLILILSGRISREYCTSFTRACHNEQEKFIKIIKIGKPTLINSCETKITLFI